MTERIENYSTSDEAGYWSEFYEHHDFDAGSSFFEFINAYPDLPSTVVDIGCGQGRDSVAFAYAGKRVFGLDRSDVGIGHASDKARSESSGGRLSFTVCDVSDEAALTEVLAAAREEAGGGNMCYYMRFFLHSIPEEAQTTLLSTIAKDAQPGDVFAAEFRTDKDIDHTRVFGDTHYRRYQNADDFSKQLQDEYNWSMVFETESRGLSPYGDEDPTLYRAVATWQQPSSDESSA